MGRTSLKLGQYEVWVVVEDQEVQHYNIDINQATTTATCWIASTAGKRFGVRFMKNHTEFACSAHVLLDGEATGGKYLFKEKLSSNIKDNIPTGSGIARPFVFGILQVADDDSLLNNTTSSRQIGEIKVDIKRVSNLSGLAPIGKTDFKVPEIQGVHEREKKAVPHRVQYGKEIASTARCGRTCTTHETVATFMIHYNSLDMLQAAGIAPVLTVFSEQAPPESSNVTSPNTSPGKRKALVPDVKAEESDGEVDEHELDEYRRRQEELEAELERVKAKLARSQDGSPRKKVKLEKKERFSRGEVIDLTL